jgi:hypothetical protein
MVYYSVHNNPPLHPILGQKNPVHMLKILFVVGSIIIVPSNLVAFVV